MGRLGELLRSIWTPREKKLHQKAIERWENEGGPPADSASAEAENRPRPDERGGS